MGPVYSINILIVDHTIVCRGLAEILRGYPDLEVVGCTASVEEAVQLCQERHPDIVSVDVDLPGKLNSFEINQLLRNADQKTRVIVLTNNKSEASIQMALQAGVSSYLLKDITPEELASAIRNTYSGQTILSPEITQTLVHAFNSLGADNPTLTRREFQVLDLISDGRTNQEIASELSISISTVQFHVKNILSKLGVHNRIEAATFAVRHALAQGA